MSTIFAIALGISAATYPPLVGTWNGVRENDSEYRRWTTGGYLGMSAGYNEFDYHFEVHRKKRGGRVWTLRLDVSRH
jgi:hypothetical protein